MMMTLSLVAGNQCGQITVDDQISVGEAILLGVKQLGCQTHDAFGQPLQYQLRVEGNAFPLPQASRLTDLHLDGQTPFVLEGIEANYTTVPLTIEHPTVSVKKSRWGRRPVLSALAVVMVGGLGTGIATWRFVIGQRRPVASAQRTGATTLSRATLQLIFSDHQQLVRSVAWSPDGTMLASGGDDGQVFIWGTDGAVHIHLAHPASVQTLAWSPDGKRLVTGSGVQLAFFDAQTGKRLARSLHAHTQMITSVAWAGQGFMQVVSAGEDKHAIVWNTTDYQIQTVYRLHTAALLSVAWSADGQTVASASAGGFIRVWNATSGVDAHGHYQDTTLPVRALSFSPTSLMLAAGGDDGVVRLWSNGLICQNTQGQGIDSLCGDRPQRVYASTSVVRTLAWSHDGRYLAVGTNDGTLSIWDPTKPQKPLVSIHQQVAIESVTWSPSGEQIALAHSTHISVLALEKL